MVDSGQHIWKQPPHIHPITLAHQSTTFFIYVRRLVPKPDPGEQWQSPAQRQRLVGAATDPWPHTSRLLYNSKEWKRDKWKTSERRGRGLFVSGKAIFSVPGVLGSGSAHTSRVYFYPWLNIRLGMFYLRLGESASEASTPSLPTQTHPRHKNEARACSLYYFACI